MSRFLDADVIHQQIERCPLAALPPRSDQSACATCVFNLAYPGHSRVGCIVNTPPDVFDRARARLEKRSPELSRELESLRVGPGLDGGAEDALANRWLKLAESWYGEAKKSSSPLDAEEIEVSMVIARFARAAITRGEPVEILR